MTDGDSPATTDDVGTPIVETAVSATQSEPGRGGNQLIHLAPGDY